METYFIRLRSQVDVDELNRLSPHQMTPVRVGPTATRLAICTDQAGMIGLLRHLHGLGFVVQSILLKAGSPN